MAKKGFVAWFKRFHLWFSVPFGLIMTLICFSGSMLVFENTITDIVYSNIYKVQPDGRQPLPVGDLVQKVAETLPEGVSITGVTISNDSCAAYKVGLTKPHRAVVCVNQYTGEITGKAERLPFFATMTRLHRWLLGEKPAQDSFSLGKWLVGASTLLFVVALVTGIVIWWPRNGASFKRRLSIHVGNGWGRFWHDLHVAGGAYAVIFLLAMALTGLTWSYSWYKEGFYKVFGTEVPKRNNAQPQQQIQAQEHGNREGAPAERGNRGGAEAEHVRSDRSGRPDDMNSERGNRGGHEKSQPAYAGWQQVYETLAGNNPGYSQITVSDGKARVSFGSLGNARAADSYGFDRRGEITSTALYADTPRAEKLGGWIYSVHVGSWGGTVTRILYFIAALLGATLPLTGYYLWIKRLLNKQKANKHIAAA